MKYIFFTFIFIFSSLSLFSQDYNGFIVKVNNNYTNQKSLQNIKLPAVFNDSNRIFKPQIRPTLTTQQLSKFEDFSNFYSFDNSDATRRMLISYQNAGIIEYFEPNYIFQIESLEQPNDTEFSKQWALQAIAAPRAWSVATGKDVLVGVIDTGIDFNHPDLIDALWINSGEDLNGNGKFDPWWHTEERNGVFGDFNGIDDDGNGFIDDVIGYDFVDLSLASINDWQNPDPIPYDEHEHGTIVTGVIAAKLNNEIGIAGVAPDSKIMVLRAFDATGSGETDDIAAAVVYAAMNGAKVLNFSFGERWRSRILDEAINFAHSLGCAMFSSSGNRASAARAYPSDFENVASVGATSSNGSRWSGSNFGSHLDFMAPGNSVLTTFLDGNYTEKTGTSLACPHAVGIAALLLEINPLLTPHEIYGIIRESANDMPPLGWDTLTGAGIVSAWNAVKTAASSIYKISTPRNEQKISVNENEILVFGTMISPLFVTYQIKVGAGRIPRSWQYESQIYTEQKVEDILDIIPINKLSAGVNMLSMTVKLRNGNTLEKRYEIEIIDEDSPLDIEFANVQPAYKNDKRVVMVGAKVNRKSRAEVLFPDLELHYTNLTYADFTHLFTIDDINLRDVEMNGILRLTDGIDTVEHNFNISIPSNDITLSGFNNKPYSLPPAYLTNKSGDLLNNGKQSITLNLLESLYIGRTEIYEFENNNFIIKDSLSDGWIPIGYGDSNGDGLIEFMGTGDAQTKLYQAERAGESVFTKEIFGSDRMRVAWGLDFFDFDGNGKEEMLVLGTDSIRHWVHSGSSYIVKQSIGLPRELTQNPPRNSYARGKFSGSSNEEVVFCDRSGRIFIFEFANNQFNLKAFDTTAKSTGNIYLESAKFDDSGKEYLVMLTHDSKPVVDTFDDNDQVWFYSIFEVIDNQVIEIYRDYIFGVRVGQFRNNAPFYRNGMTVGDITGDGYDEMIISTYPNLYALSYDVDNNRVEAAWGRPFSFSNSAIIADFDNNGTNEIGFSTTQSTQFFEITENSKKLLPPSNLRGYTTNQTTGIVEFTTRENASGYNLYRILSSNQAEFYGYYTSNKITIDTLTPNQEYAFILTSVGIVEGEAVESSFTFPQVAYIYTVERTIPIDAKPLDNRNISISFDGVLPYHYVENTRFKLIDKNTRIIYPNVNIVNGEKELFLMFSAPLQPDKYTLIVESFKDYYGNPTNEGTFEVEIEQAIGEEFLQVVGGNLNKTAREVEIIFSEEINPETIKLESFNLNPSGDIKNVSLGANPNALKIVLSDDIFQIARGLTYTITCKYISSISDKNINPRFGNAFSFVVNAPNLDNPYTYPAPFRLSENLPLYFGNLTNSAEISVFTLEGELVAELKETRGIGGLEWEARDLKGNPLKVGIYLYQVKGKDETGKSFDSEFQKIMVID